MTQYLWDEHFEAKKNHGERRSELERRMGELDNFIQEAYEDKVRGDLDEESWRVMDMGWKSEQESIKAEYDALMGGQDEYMQRGVELIELMQHAEIIFKNATPEKKRKMVELVSSNLLLANGTLEYDWKKPFNMLAVKGDLEDWRPLGNCSGHPGLRPSGTRASCSLKMRVVRILSNPSSRRSASLHRTLNSNIAQKHKNLFC